MHRRHCKSQESENGKRRLGIRMQPAPQIAPNRTSTAVTPLPVPRRPRQMLQCYTLAEDGLAASVRAALPFPWPCRYRARSIFIGRISSKDRIRSQVMEIPLPSACRTRRLEVRFAHDSPRSPRILRRDPFLHCLCCGRHRPRAPRRRPIFARREPAPR